MSCEDCSLCSTGALVGDLGLPPRSDGVTRIALLGQPNSGKSTIFNRLTGARQHVGNWPGKTVEQKMGGFSRDGRAYELIDLPGSYSLNAQSPEEAVTRDYIVANSADLVLVVVDASQLERSCYMLADFVGLRCPAILVVNLVDVASAQGKSIDVAALERRLGIPVVPLVASEKSSYGPLFGAIADRGCRSCVQDAELDAILKRRLGNQLDDVEKHLPKEGIGASSRTWLATKLIAGDEGVAALVEQSIPGKEWQQVEGIVSRIPDGIQDVSAAKFAWVEQVLDGIVSGEAQTPRLSRFDRIATGSRASVPITLAAILGGFLLAFVPALPIMGIGGAISYGGMMLSDLIVGSGGPEVLGSFLSGVVCNALCFAIMMVGYVFGINLVFGLYEDIGYMARISYVFDHVMSKFGLQGKSVMPFLMCFGCTMGGVSGSRVIDSWGQRMLTVAMSWAIPCGSTWGVVPVLAIAFFGWGAPLVIVGIFAVCILLMAIIGLLFRKKLVPEGDRAGLVMELPPYHKPHVKNILRGALLKSWAMLKRAFKVVAVFALAIWALTYSPTGIEGSLLYMIGTAIEPAIEVFGLTWETFTAWVCALAIKESALGVLSGLFADTGTVSQAVIGAVSGSAVVAGNLGELMALSITPPQALAFIFAFTFNMPCAASVSATFGEVHSAKWTAVCAAFYIAFSLILAFIVYHAALVFF